MLDISSFFFFQAEDGIRDYKVTGVQTCALPIFAVLQDLVGIGRPRDAEGDPPLLLPDAEPADRLDLAFAPDLEPGRLDAVLHVANVKRLPLRRLHADQAGRKLRRHIKDAVDPLDRLLHPAG